MTSEHKTPISVLHAALTQMTQTVPFFNEDYSNVNDVFLLSDAVTEYIRFYNAQPYLEKYFDYVLVIEDELISNTRTVYVYPAKGFTSSDIRKVYNQETSDGMVIYSFMYTDADTLDSLTDNYLFKEQYDTFKIEKYL